jgi:hypothetical protein
MGKKKLLYIAFKDFSNLHFGANAKVLSQCRAFSEYEYDVDLIGRSGHDTVLIHTNGDVQVLTHHDEAIKNKKLHNLLDKRHQVSDTIRFLRDKHYDACYVRYDFSDPGFLKLLKVVDSVCPVIALELPTYPYEQENSIGTLNKIKMSIDLRYRKQLHQYVDFIVTFYGGYDNLFGIPVLVVPNGFDFSTMQLVESNLPNDGIHIIAVSSMREWHGYERMIEGMHLYYQNGEENKQNFILHLVGNGREYGKYAKLVAEYGLEKHIVMEGAMHGKALDALYEKCALGIDSLARHRSGISVLSSLKSREYGAKGLPIINSCKIDILGTDFPYMLQVPADELPIDMGTIGAFYDQCFSSKSRLEVGEEIRSYIMNKAGMKETLLDVVRRFQV